MKPRLPSPAARAPVPATSIPPRRFAATTGLSLLLLLVAGLAAYHNSFSGILALDDYETIAHNTSIRQLAPLSTLLSPPSPSGVAGRPLANITFALNYALSGAELWSYHALNLGIHLLAALTLFAVIRRTLLQPRCRDRFRTAATPLALAAAALWTVHPLQTQVVDYLSQRTEALMGLCYLATLYGFIRATSQAGAPLHAPSSVAAKAVKLSSKPETAEGPDNRPRGARPWLGLSVAACLAGMASKEVMITAPVMVFLYDRTFVTGSFLEAWRRRWSYYLALAATWILLGFLILDLQQRGVGFAGGVSAFHYLLTQCKVLVLYLGLALWPHPLIFDRGMDFLKHTRDALPYALVLLPLLAGTIVALRWRPALGFIGGWFFILLAPTSSFVPLFGQPMAESRMYLPLAGIVVFAVVGLYLLAGRRSLLAWVAVAILFGTLTIRRNSVYRSEESLWADTVAKQPSNARAQNNYAEALLALGRREDAIRHYSAAIAAAPDYNLAHFNLGELLLNENRIEEAIPHFETALIKNPNHAGTHMMLGKADLQRKRPASAIAHFEKALQVNPRHIQAHNLLGITLYQLGRVEEGVRHLTEAARLDPDLLPIRNNLGMLLLQLNRSSEAIGHFEAVLRGNPSDPDAHVTLGIALTRAGRSVDGVRSFEAAVQQQPTHLGARFNLGSSLVQLGRPEAAIGHLEQALKIQPDFPEAHYSLGLALQQTGREREAVRHFEEALRLKPEFVEAQQRVEKTNRN